MLLRLAFLFVLCGVSAGAFAWGADGHRIVGEIAWHYLQPETKTKVSRLLKIAGEPSLAEASTWADRIRSDRRYDWAAPMHYISLPRHWDGYREARDCPPAGCILKAIEDFEKKLSDRNVIESERAEALMFVAHFIGDLHQPLHTGLAADRGGNDIEVRFFGFPTNLHSLWDVYLPAGFVQDWKKYASAQLEVIDEQQQSRWLSGDKTEWAAESQRLVHSHAYTTEKALGEDYYLRNREIVALRLRQGGVRLAAVLNWALGE
ncbi:S1/P1 nuclease [Microbulbifer thermotolerans]|uniref:S1/P1 nuclease n=1 Tax=Microbulbifer thermotolerans TaxID=252514 RepID=UPI00224B754A|nr:S1/P1 nuclease [Microbulbifer thermotolerans]MCX2840152.1 S1/P1 nuclease [Microbulbifer thermotolerans]